MTREATQILNDSMNKLPNAGAQSNTEDMAEASLSEEIRSLLRGLRKEVAALRDELASLRETTSDSGEDDTLLTRQEAAKRLRISTRTLDDLEAGGRLQAVRIGRRVLYHPSTLDAFVRRQSREGRK